MNKESTHRSHELKNLGWNQEDLTRYEELWEYSKRWGLINLEIEERQFLKKAEKLLPKIQAKKNSVKKPIEQKSYFLWLKSYFDEIQIFDRENLNQDEKSVWHILIEVELQLLKTLKPVMGLPDTIKAKNLQIIRKNLLEKTFNQYEAINSKNLFNFDFIVKSTDSTKSKSWKSILENDNDLKAHYPLINKKFLEKFQSEAYDTIEKFMKNNYPSLKDDL